MTISVAATNSEASHGQPQHSYDAKVNIISRTLLETKPAAIAAKTQIFSEYMEKTFLICRQADFLNGDLSKEVAITYKQSRGNQIEISAGDYKFYFEKNEKSALEPVTRNNRIKTGKDIFQPPRPGEVDGLGYIREYMLGLLGHMAEKEKFELADELRIRVNQIKGLRAHPLSTTEGFLVSDGIKQRFVTYSQFINTNKADISIIVPAGHRAEPNLYFCVPIEMVEAGNTFLFRYKPTYPVSMKHNGDPGLSDEGHAAWECIFSVAKFIMDKDGKKLKCMPEYLDETTKAKFKDFFKPDHALSTPNRADAKAALKKMQDIEIMKMHNDDKSNHTIAKALRVSRGRISTLIKESEKSENPSGIPTSGKKDEEDMRKVGRMWWSGNMLKTIQLETGLGQKKIRGYILKYTQSEPSVSAALQNIITYGSKEIVSNRKAMMQAQFKSVKDVRREAVRKEVEERRAAGMPIKKIADELNCSITSVSRRIKETEMMKVAQSRAKEFEVLKRHDEGKTNIAISKELGISQKKVGRWIRAHEESENPSLVHPTIPKPRVNNNEEIRKVGLMWWGGNTLRTIQTETGLSEKQIYKRIVKYAQLELKLKDSSTAKDSISDYIAMMGKHREELKAVQKKAEDDEILKKHEEGKSIHAIAVELKISRKKVARSIKKHEESEIRTAQPNIPKLRKDDHEQLQAVAPLGLQEKPAVPSVIMRNFLRGARPNSEAEWIKDITANPKGTDR